MFGMLLPLAAKGARQFETLICVHDNWLLGWTHAAMRRRPWWWMGAEERGEEERRRERGAIEALRLLREE